VPWGLSGVTEDLATLLILPGMAMAIPAVWSLALRFRRAVGIERQQLRFMMPSVILLAGFYVTLLISDAVFGVEFSLTDEVMWVFVSLIVLSYTLAILRYRLYEIDRLVSRTVSYTLLVLSLGMVFALGVVYIPNQLSKDAPPWLVAASTLAVAALFNPLRSRVQSWVDRKFNRARFDAQRVMDDFSATLLEQGDERDRQRAQPTSPSFEMRRVGRDQHQEEQDLDPRDEPMRTKRLTVRLHYTQHDRKRDVGAERERDRPSRLHANVSTVLIPGVSGRALAVRGARSHRANRTSAHQDETAPIPAHEAATA